MVTLPISRISTTLLLYLCLRLKAPDLRGAWILHVVVDAWSTPYAKSNIVRRSRWGSYSLPRHDPMTRLDSVRHRSSLVRPATALQQQQLQHQEHRRNALVKLSVAARAFTLVGPYLFPPAAWSLVKGVPPPSNSIKPISDRPRCTNVEECQAIAERKEQQMQVQANEVALTANPLQMTARGTRYRDLLIGTGTEASLGDQVQIYYKVLKLGKRSYDGLSGEGTVVFSRGYGLEDDETEPVIGTKYAYTTILGNNNNIAALNDGIPGMKVGGLRRFVIRPELGWRKPGRACDGGPGGQGAGGELRTDYIVVPTATMVAEETCFDTSKQPFPNTYPQQRRMAQRFDQSLIMEVTLVSVQP